MNPIQIIIKNLIERISDSVIEKSKIEMNVKDVSLLFNIEPVSVCTARYRIRKKNSESKIHFAF